MSTSYIEGYSHPPSLHFDPVDLSLKLNSYYAGACTNGLIDTNKVVGAFKMLGITIAKPLAAQVLIRIAGPSKRITQNSFTTTIIDFIFEQESTQPTRGLSHGFVAPPQSVQAPPPPYQPQYGPPPQPYGNPYPPPGVYGPPPQQYPPISLPPPIPAPASKEPVSSPQPPPQPTVITSGPQANAPDPGVAQRVAKFYADVTVSGRIDGYAVINICREFGVACDLTVAAQLLEITAGPERKITQPAFVHHIGIYITRNLGVSKA